MTTDKTLDGKVAIVTGAGRNIGRAIALMLAGQGASIIVNVRSNKTEADEVVSVVTAAGAKAVAVLGDVADPATADRLAVEAIKHFGRVDILVNNAAIRREATLDELTLAAWREVMASTIDASFLGAKAVAPHMKRVGGGSIINIGGLSAHTGAKGRAHVITAKAGMIGLTRALAADLAGDGITVNCVVPGLIDTSRDAGVALPSHHQVSRTLVGRLGKPDEIAGAVAYLASTAGRYVTGQTLHVNGGAYLG